MDNTRKSHIIPNTYHGPQIESDTQGTFREGIGRNNGAILAYRNGGRVLPSFLLL